MGSDVAAPVVDKVNVPADTPIDGQTQCPTKKKVVKVPKRIHKSEREKKKREHLNDLFVDLANVLDITEQSNGKASILCETTRLLKELFGQIDSLTKENASLLSESSYVTIEKNELLEENSALESQIQKLQTEIETRISQSKRNLNEPPLQFHQSQLASHVQVESYKLPSTETPLQQVFVVPIGEMQAYPTHDASQVTTNISKPQARYPKPSDSWPLQLLGQSISTTETNQNNI